MDDRYGVSDWVLSKFSAEELIDIDNEIYDQVVAELKKKIKKDEYSEKSIPDRNRRNMSLSARAILQIRRLGSIWK
jgi:hypothetical protein